MLDEDHRNAELDHQSFRVFPSAPYWHDEKSYACDHGERSDVAVIGSEGGPSDSVYELCMCNVCGRKWSRWIEG